MPMLTVAPMPLNYTCVEKQVKSKTILHLDFLLQNVKKKKREKMFNVGLYQNEHTSRFYIKMKIGLGFLKYNMCG